MNDILEWIVRRYVCEWALIIFTVLYLIGR